MRMESNLVNKQDSKGKSPNNPFCIPVAIFTGIIISAIAISTGIILQAIP